MCPSIAGEPGPCSSNDSGGRRPPRLKRGAIDCRLSSFTSEVLDRRDSAAIDMGSGDVDVMEYHICDEVGRWAADNPPVLSGKTDADAAADDDALAL